MDLRCDRLLGAPAGRDHHQDDQRDEVGSRRSSEASHRWHPTCYGHSATLKAASGYRKTPLDKWSVFPAHTGMADQKAPDYTLAPTLTFDITDQYRELFEDTSMQIVDLLLERAATIKELAETLDLPKGTIGHHVAVLEKAGLIKVVRTKKVRRPVARSGQFCIPIPRLGHDAARIDTRGPDRRLARARLRTGMGASLPLPRRRRRHDCSIRLRPSQPQHLPH